jgi:transposase-like protein
MAEKKHPNLAALYEAATSAQPAGVRGESADRACHQDLGIHKEALREWVRQAEADSYRRRYLLSTEEREEPKRLRRENFELRRANAILKDAPDILRQELDLTQRRRRSRDRSASRLRRSIAPLEHSSHEFCQLRAHVEASDHVVKRYEPLLDLGGGHPARKREADASDAWRFGFDHGPEVGAELHLVAARAPAPEPRCVLGQVLVQEVGDRLPRLQSEPPLDPPTPTPT